MDDIFSPISRGPSHERRLAVLIGIDRYQGGIRPLGNAVRDIHAVADVLRGSAESAGAGNIHQARAPIIFRQPNSEPTNRRRNNYYADPKLNQ